MQRTVKIIKRRQAVNADSVPGIDGFLDIDSKKTDQQRGTANAIKTWIAEFEQRQRSLHRSAFALIRSTEHNRNAQTEDKPRPINQVRPAASANRDERNEPCTYRR